MIRPPLSGVIERRLLINYRVDPDVAARLLPEPFRPQLVAGQAVVGICLLRLGSMRPRGLPAWTGLRSENAAHRIAVEWDGSQGLQTGVYIPRRDSDSRVNIALGGRLYPGHHHFARFTVSDTGSEHSVRYASTDGSVTVDARVTQADELTGSHLFADLAAASRFFQNGSIGYSAARQPTHYDGLQLATSAWTIHPSRINHVRSSYFDDPNLFPRGTAHLDCALIMREVPVHWIALAPLQADRRQNPTSPAGRFAAA